MRDREVKVPGASGMVILAMAIYVLGLYNTAVQPVT
jgi:hypothetical protein